MRYVSARWGRSPMRCSKWAGSTAAACEAAAMGHRLSAIATRTGDEGTTGLGDGSRVSKSDPRVAAMGDVDELNSCIGMLIAIGVPEDELRMPALLADIQQDLLDLGGELSIPGYTLLKPERVIALDEWLQPANPTPPPHQELKRPRDQQAAAQTLGWP